MATRVTKKAAAPAPAERVLNKKLIKRIVAQISAVPKAWDQGAWVETTTCGTSRCFAGWAMFLEGYTDEIGQPTVKGWRFFKEHDLTHEVNIAHIDPESGLPDWNLPYEAAAAIVLGISREAAYDLFDSEAGTCSVRTPDGYREWKKNDLKTMKAKITQWTGIKDFRIRTKAAA